MSNPVLNSFDPFALHPFTNGSGVLPPPPKPSQYPILIPSPRIDTSSYSPTSPGGTSASPSSLPSPGSPQTPPQLKIPQPRYSQSPPTSAIQPIFVPFRHETSSPDLVLRKKPTSSSSFTDSYRLSDNVLFSHP
ncbi:hypothetical protein H0H92_012329 [Tricholoma furcatifolium]|nr:hypothetical protein H0H92_012329 [Tricholoma furcatifolium]